MRDRCMLSFTKEQLTSVGEYCTLHSSPLPKSVEEQCRVTDERSQDEVVMAPSPAQCAWLMSFALASRPRRILELGTFTGVSTLAFYEGTRKTKAEIITVDMSEEYLQIAETAFRRHGATDRIQTIRGPCLEILPTITGEFDLIYIDAAEEEYEAYTRFVLDHKLLSAEGVMLVDDGTYIRWFYFFQANWWSVLLEGLVVDRSIVKEFPEEIQEPYLGIADQMNDFNRYARSDPRVEVTMIPLFNGVTQITWK
ncbi:hypothetical protein BBP40_009480 [Aspergillus hancockii]|uniref:O-methyltransferase hkm8 n=1 Tax=Aspergillus hancockii TaxID=1873369 RepID=HKM8_ASPHA|nr:RecName: Full=O-methyltransferase hkm8; AltName: Full=Hancockiamides biosynthesis cluster protein 8 [Aspergillus hancockii]KAF7597142.1 hypothetical protein BBP40_009480 [Aspergillus hancockii]